MQNVFKKTLKPMALLSSYNEDNINKVSLALSCLGKSKRYITKIFQELSNQIMQFVMASRILASFDMGIFIYLFL